MKLSMCSASLGNIPLKQSINRAAELGFDGIEITVMFHAHPSISCNERKTISGWLKNSGIACSALHFIYDKKVNLASTLKEDINHSIMHNRAVIDLAADLGTNVIVVGGGGTRSVKPGQNREEIEKVLMEIFLASGEYAKEKGVILGLEALNRYETNIIRTLRESKEMTDRIKSPNVKVMGDTYHMNIEEVSLDGAIREMGQDLIHLHLADSNRLAPGEGHIDYRSVFKALKEINYQGYCSLEVFGITPELLCFSSYEEADMHMVKGKKYLDDLLLSC